MAVYPSSTNNQEWFDWTVYNTENALLFALEFPTGPGSRTVYYELSDQKYQSTGQSFSNGVPYLLTIQMDFAANQWSATLGSIMLVTNLPINSTTNALTLREIDPQWLIRDAAKPGDDFMVFDDYKIVAHATTHAGSGPTLQIKRSSGTGAIALTLLGQPSTNYALEASTDLRSWAPLGSLSSPSGTSEFADTNASSLNLRFYRARQAIP
jgi:hypothetical protein